MIHVTIVFSLAYLFDIDASFPLYSLIRTSTECLLLDSTHLSIIFTCSMCALMFILNRAEEL